MSARIAVTLPAADGGARRGLLDAELGRRTVDEAPMESASSRARTWPPPVPTRFRGRGLDG
ncbi:hypothetical protein [Streptomyces iranensis]|uniref:Uncharacterized protein n=1 Tax=Streptomyces iranensis TaxID=576784 RepID=A0ABS4MK93_9ACTN|nr:hypothetical protein [Streptomyces iranensis]MBP2060117.1 hypothetical protein [Streptomyces iranensis]